MEFTSVGTYVLNNGASATGTIPETDTEVSAGPTDAITVEAVDPWDYVCRKNFQYRNADNQGEFIFFGSHLDCAYGYVNLLYNEDGEMVGIDSFSHEDPEKYLELFLTELPGSDPRIPETYQDHTEIADSDSANGNLEMGPEYLLFLVQFFAFGLVGYGYKRRRKLQVRQIKRPLRFSREVESPYEHLLEGSKGGKR
jgi:hypothetical protein